MFDINGILQGLAGRVGQLEGVQGPPQANGQLPVRTAPIGGTDMMSKGGGLDMSLVAPILQGLLADEQQAPIPAASGGPVTMGGRGGNIIGPTFAQNNPASIRNRM